MIATKEPQQRAKHTKSRKPGSARRVALKRQILAESAATVARGGGWRRSDYPALAALLDDALRVARHPVWRLIPKSFSHKGVKFHLEITTLGRVIVRAGTSRQFVVSSGFFAV